MSRSALLIAVAGFVLTCPPRIGAVNFHSSYSPPAANASLPSHVVAPSGQVTLFADLQHPGEDFVPLYLVNRSSEPFTADQQDGDLYLKLEYQTPDGDWRRAQTHQYSGCGNSYGVLVLPPGQYVLAKGYRPKAAKQGEVRYAGYGSVSLISNEGAGHYTLEDAERSRYDRMSGRNIPRTLARHLQFENDWVRPDASLSWAQKISASRLLHALGGVPAARNQRQQWIRELSSLKVRSKEEDQVLQALAALESQPWSEKLDQGRLFDLCAAALSTTAPDADDVASPDREMMWRTLAELAQFGQKPGAETIDLEKWRPVVEQALVEIQATDLSHSGYGLQHLLDVAPLIDELVPSSKLEPFVIGKSPQARHVAVASLARRNQHDRVAELAQPLGMREKLGVLAVLARTVTQPNRDYFRVPAYDSKEEAFWTECMAHDPLLASAALSGVKHLPFNVVEPLRSFWQRQLATKTGEFPLGENAGQFRSAARLFAGSLYSGDRKILRDMLNFGGFEVTNGVRSDSHGKTTHFKWQYFAVREIARRALVQSGEALPDGIVIKREILPSMK